MRMEFQSNIPIYLQIMDDIKQQIVSGKLKPGDKLASVRDLAMQYGVNPNTMQKALSELEWEKLLYTMRTAGRYVTEDAALIGVLREQLAQERIIGLLNELQQLGYQNEEILNLLQRYMKGEIANDSVSGI
ncbi:MAG: GntR family transcriptional regulator [Peptococcaceae bacterium]|jgi:DNA-binding transcriptional regulator YhcF (GntR family)|nr:GntR family transcriptional regulator [Peptococcaceae bacterium]MBQ2369195.1 GntR family transcriptional regulator [Peptococcaceae bacterium]MBQ2431836.1 GntR family transcriptional regulator [Peptococcaceae bacterium]MBQ5368940.1 GntR family transcriptional regulator [Peptococcaceae bacterium]MBQ5614864.1 GntR family transcriptional regulator [Peptococcaceae bacterium]